MKIGTETGDLKPKPGRGVNPNHFSHPPSSRPSPQGEGETRPAAWNKKPDDCFNSHGNSLICRREKRRRAAALQDAAAQYGVQRPMRSASCELKPLGAFGRCSVGSKVKMNCYISMRHRPNTAGDDSFQFTGCAGRFDLECPSPLAWALRFFLQIGGQMNGHAAGRNTLPNQRGG